MSEHFNLFNTTDQVIVHNPTSKDFRFMVGGEREYEVKAKQFKLLHGSAARLYVKKMVDMYHIKENRITDLHNKGAEAETAKMFVKRVISDDMELNEKTIAQLVKDSKPDDVPEPESEPTKAEKQEENIKSATEQDIAPAKTTIEPEFPEVNQTSDVLVAKK